MRYLLIFPAMLIVAAGLVTASAPFDSPLSRALAQGRQGDRSGLRVTATRLPQNPLVTVASSASLGDNINGPSIVRVPAWVTQPLGRYYMYFAHHKGLFIRMAYADAIEGPWKIYEPGVVQARDTAFFRPQPDRPDLPGFFYTHIASPEVSVDALPNRLVLWFHGWWTNGAPWPANNSAATQAWARQRGYGQFTQVADSSDGLHFDVHGSMTKESYLRVFREGRYFYGLARLGLLSRSTDPLAAFEFGPNPFRDTRYANRVRHVALVRRGNMLFVFFTAIGDAPEHVLVSTIDLIGDWQTWKASAPIDLLQPEASYECPDLPDVPSVAGEIEGRARQIRDPAVLEENGKAWLFYTICGEQGIAAAELNITM